MHLDLKTREEGTRRTQVRAMGNRVDSEQMADSRADLVAEDCLDSVEVQERHHQHQDMVKKISRRFVQTLTPYTSLIDTCLSPHLPIQDTHPLKDHLPIQNLINRPRW